MLGTLFNSPIGYILLAGLVIFVMFRRFQGTPAQAKRMLLLPVILLAAGLLSLSKESLSASVIGYLVLSVVIGAGFGLLRGASVRVSERHGLAYLSYTGWTIGLWVASILAKIATGFVWHLLAGSGASSAGNSTMIAIGAGLLAEGAISMYRALHGTGRVMWAQGKDGAPHTMSPHMDQWQQRLQNKQSSR